MLKVGSYWTEVMMVYHVVFCTGLIHKVHYVNLMPVIALWYKCNIPPSTRAYRAIARRRSAMLACQEPNR